MYNAVTSQRWLYCPIVRGALCPLLRRSELFLIVSSTTSFRLPERPYLVNKAIKRWLFSLGTKVASSGVYACRMVDSQNQLSHQVLDIICQYSDKSAPGLFGNSRKPQFEHRSKGVLETVW